MCGIAGLVSPGGQTVDASLLRRMTDALSHRGPDGEGLHVAPGVGLGHRRLSIIDLQGGGQPIFNEDQTLAIVFNGEVYNYRELTSELTQLGHAFRTLSDTEAIVHAYEAWGPACLDRFIGMFAIALWDAPRRELFLARDRFGKKPLYYRMEDGRLAFASELKALMRDDAFPPKLDLHALDGYLTFGYTPGDRCIVAGVEKLAPGHWLRWRDGQIETRCYWSPNFTPDPRPSEREWQERLEATLRDAVRLRLRSDVPLGVFLSGGVDSSAITALACEELGAATKTYSIGFREREHDELPYARQVAEHFKSDHHELIVDDRDIGVLEEIAYHLDEPFADPSALPTYYVCREARKHVTVVLSGDGGDELFAGYARYGAALSYARADLAPAPLRRAVGGVALALTPTQVWGRGLIERLSLNGAGRYLSQMAAFSHSERRALWGAGRCDLAGAGLERFSPWFDRYGRDDLLAALQGSDQANYLPDDILVKVDRMAMRHSLEARCPLLDHRVAELANAMPAKFKRRGRHGKLILKRMLARRLPAAILERRKRGFGIPIRKWFRSSLQDYARDWLLGPSARIVDVLERDAIGRLIEAHASGMRDFSRRIWTLLMLEHWRRRYGI